jgi:hypothetical protein
MACYDLQLANSGSEEWILSNYNIAIFYDASALCFERDTLLLEDLIYDPSITGVITSASGTPLPYEENLGFLRAGMAANAPGVLMDTSGTWISASRLCFSIKFDDITSDSTCVQMNFNSAQLQPFVGVPPNIVQEWDPNVFISDIPLGVLNDVIPDATRNSCFILEENSTALCTDGIDNDEDGYADCDDISSCSTGDPIVMVRNPDCIDTLGQISIQTDVNGVLFSFDGGVSFTPDSVKSDLSEGEYNLLAIKNEVEECSFSESVILSFDDICVENTGALCSDGIDNDGDGLLDCEDPDCIPVIDTVMVSGPVDCPLLGDGRISIETVNDQIEFSIDSGKTYQLSGIYTDLPEGEYYIFIRNSLTECLYEYDYNPLVLDADTTCQVMIEKCIDGIDNDGDGLVDCGDPDCGDFNECLIDMYLPNTFSPRSLSNNRFGLTVENGINLTIRDFTIFNRWGSEVFKVENISASDPAHHWDGRINGVLVTPGVYTYQLNISYNGNNRQIYGDITVLN